MLLKQEQCHELCTVWLLQNYFWLMRVCSWLLFFLTVLNSVALVGSVFQQSSCLTVSVSLMQAFQFSVTIR